MIRKIIIQMDYKTAVVMMAKITKIMHSLSRYYMKIVLIVGGIYTNRLPFFEHYINIQFEAGCFNMIIFRTH